MSIKIYQIKNEETDRKIIFYPDRIDQYDFSVYSYKSGYKITTIRYDECGPEVKEIIDSLINFIK